MTANSTPAAPRSSPGTSSALRHARIADTIVLAALGAAALAALAIGASYDALALGATIGLPLLAGGMAAYFFAGGSTASRLALAFTLSAMVALHIQLGRGTVEFHFGVFVTLALLLVYRDWRPIVASAGFFAVHHVLVDRLQASGFAVYCTPEPNLLKIVMHAGYVVVQTGLEVLMAVWMARMARAGTELERLVAAVDGEGGAVALDVASLRVRTPVARALQRVLGRMNAALRQVQSSASDIRAASVEIANGTTNLSTRTEQTASSLQQAAASMEQLTGTVTHTASSARQANDLAASAAGVAGRGGDLVEQVVATMGDIDSSSKKIVDIISVIDGIAFQTNILALNAAVEAARAGEQGRGFAVVAGEVRALAQRSASAAKEIKVLIGSSVERVAQGTRLVGDAGRTMTDIVESVRSVSKIVDEISTASHEQSQGLGLVNGSVGALEQMTQQNSALVEESTAAAETLRAQAEKLAGVLRGFQLGAVSGRAS